MTRSLLAWIPLLLFAACSSQNQAPPDGGGDAADLGGGTADGGSMCTATSPSGYACDSWSTHLYVTDLAKRQGATLRLTLEHNPDFEGQTNDTTIPPEHDFVQTLTVDLELTDAVRRFVCVVFTAAATPASFDASSPGFLTTVDPGYKGLVAEVALPNSPSVTDLIDICGSSLPAVRWPSFVNPSGTNKPSLAAIALAIPLTPSPQQFQVGTTFGAWLARGILNVDEESELSPKLTAKVVAVQ